LKVFEDFEEARVKNGILLWMSAILVIGLSSCFCNKVDPEPADAFEPNNTTAQAVLMPDSLEATMNEGEAPDVFAFEATAGQRIGLVFTQLSGSFLVLMAEIRAPDGTLIGNVERLQGYYGGSSSQPPLEFIAPASGRYTGFVLLGGALALPPATPTPEYTQHAVHSAVCGSGRHVESGLEHIQVRVHPER
jgi:hypothetical protein